jgi:hypothetical protein
MPVLFEQLEKFASRIEIQNEDIEVFSFDEVIGAEYERVIDVAR